MRLGSKMPPNTIVQELIGGPHMIHQGLGAKRRTRAMPGLNECAALPPHVKRYPNGASASVSPVSGPLPPQASFSFGSATEEMILSACPTLERVCAMRRRTTAIMQ